MLTGIILGAGQSKRMGRNKLNLELNEIRIIDRVVSSCLLSKLDRVILVYSKGLYLSEDLKAKVDLVLNPNPGLGQSYSLKLGLGALEGPSDLMFILGDQPFITSDLIDYMIASFKDNPSRIITPYYGGKRSTPTIFPGEFIGQMTSLEGDQGARSLIEKNPERAYRLDISDPRYGLDIDRPQDYDKAVAIENKRVGKWKL